MERATELRNWLTRVGAMPLNEVKGPNGSTLAFYSINGRCCIIQQWTRREGMSWQIYVPPTDSAETAKTFAAAEVVLEVVVNA
jgi:hypothetical protein